MILIAGCGYVGGRLAELLVEDGRPVAGLKRNASTVPNGVLGIAADVSDPATLSGLRGSMGQPVDALVYAISPAGRSEDAYRTVYVDGLRNVITALTASGSEPRRVILVSSTGVYGQEDGRWVDEDTPPEPADATGRVLLEGERLIGELGRRGIVLRLGGIYGPGRTRTVQRVLSGQAGCPDPESFGNRIHRDDAAGALRHLLDLPDAAPLYVGVDRDPAPLRDVYRWIAERGGVADPCEKEEPDNEGAPGRRGTNKRCSSRRLAESGYRFRFPTFREGYRPIVDELSD